MRVILDVATDATPLFALFLCVCVCIFCYRLSAALNFVVSDLAMLFYMIDGLIEILALHFYSVMSIESR